MNKNVKIALIAVFVVLGVSLLWFAGTYNSLVGSSNEVDASWGKVQSAYQRRADLVPNLVKVAKASGELEKSILLQVTQARAGIDAAQTPGELQQAADNLEMAINVVFESYPEITSTENYLVLQDQLEGTENRIKIERDNYTDAVMRYNNKVMMFPSNIVAGMFHYSTREMFKALQGTDTAPDVGELL